MQEKVNILVVDDKPGIRISLAGILEYEGYNVVVADDGYKAIDAAKKTSFKIAFIDMRMPGIDGLKTLEEIRKVDPKTQVIIMSGYDIEGFVEKAISQGAFACVSKPIDMVELFPLMAKAIKKIGEK